MGYDVAVVPVMEDEAEEVVMADRFSVILLMPPPPLTLNSHPAKCLPESVPVLEVQQATDPARAWVGVPEQVSESVTCLHDLSPLGPGCGVVVGNIESMFILELDPMGANTCPAATITATVEVAKSNSEPKLVMTTLYSCTVVGARMGGCWLARPLQHKTVGPWTPNPLHQGLGHVMLHAQVETFLAGSFLSVHQYGRNGQLRHWSPHLCCVLLFPCSDMLIT